MGLFSPCHTIGAIPRSQSCGTESITKTLLLEIIKSFTVRYNYSPRTLRPDSGQTPRPLSTTACCNDTWQHHPHHRVGTQLHDLLQHLTRRSAQPMTRERLVVEFQILTPKKLKMVMWRIKQMNGKVNLNTIWQMLGCFFLGLHHHWTPLISTILPWTSIGRLKIRDLSKARPIHWM